ncbi:hypothetical protein MLD38_014585 [Melastoma candidum]|uniref:Uncharacterized protein n=1 Tax=Melastoma candidum TaxID=119954 RepID=A0ACB9REL3_9MYRT|nr:hypothetical protein MLD38_014585 [Melastoma candidum]
MPGSSRPRSSAPVLRPLSPHRFYVSSSSSPPPPIPPDYSSYPFASSTNLFNHRSASPPHVSVGSSRSPSISSSSVRFSTDRPVSPNRSLVVSPRHHVLRKGDDTRSASIKKTCMCSPTSHPGSFRCSLHKNVGAANGGRNGHPSFMPSRSNIWSLAMKNSLVRIGGVEGDLVRRALTALIHPSSHQQRRRAAFQPRPSRLSVMSKASDP